MPTDSETDEEEAIDDSGFFKGRDGGGVTPSAAHRDRPFRLDSAFKPMGDQPTAIASLVERISSGERFSTLLGATGTGKTFTMAHTIEKLQRPTLIISHNKTLAAQLYEEMKELFPDNAVSYFVSYYDYYQPEAYIPQRDIYIEKDSSRNDDLDRLRLAATSALVSRRDVIVVASVSCIFGLGSPDEYKKHVVALNVGQSIKRRDLLRSFADMQYSRSEYDLKRASFRVRGDVIEIVPAGEEYAVRIEMFGDEIESLNLVNPLTGELLADERAVFIYPAVNYVLPEDEQSRAISAIKEELDERVAELRSEGKLLEAQRLLARTKYDLEQLEELGFCNGIENYSRHLDGRPAGSMPYTLLDYFPDSTRGMYTGGFEERGPDGEKPEGRNPSMADRVHERPDGTVWTGPAGEASAGDWLMIIDESHVTLPQLHAMYHGDRHRKETLVEHGFRLPSAMDNRPLTYDEIEKKWPQVVFVSATPGAYELEKSGGEVAEQVIRPTGLLDPVIEVHPAEGQVPDLLERARKRVAAGERILVTTLTKRLAEDLASYLAKNDIKCRYLHSDIETLDRVVLLRELREGDFDVLVGVNLLREGLDLPEVSLVCIMDADKEGFLRSGRSLIQQIGRAARNQNAYVVMYADEVTPSMAEAMEETERRREKQLAYNAEHGITPRTIKKAIRRGIENELRARKTAREAATPEGKEYDREELLGELQKAMMEAAQNLDFEKAAALRDKIKEVKEAPNLGKITLTRGEAAAVKPGTPGTKVKKKKKKNAKKREG
ncbi:excinuclease ABC subunit UvrB [Phycisphaera mikurensis]|uniref:UvrABC system protein B n=1 Tax=Phycisphaera mikurensis (strain NBRC 102666 / KCTC 22515 / FYK2301M01) TaxID=1142394 RepID=I0IFN8_PHYMF|nr:excinuclease ABC subunit UvrB [Phycisphaera mikurensis]MBB6440534.1 excinuclease ABC subunit B [Phycisphaera mikurensis]BAM04076.1 UvrABC system protein B [Phycisphaera mikurensis NBRC 102666]